MIRDVFNKAQVLDLHQERLTDKTERPFLSLDSQSGEKSRQVLWLMAAYKRHL